MQNWLLQLQSDCHIYNPEIEPEHDSDQYPCGCSVHKYTRAKWGRCDVQDMWSRAVLYPGESHLRAAKAYGAKHRGHRLHFRRCWLS
jgi:hypothetical protein